MEYDLKEKVVHSSCCIVLPEDKTAQIQAIRSLHAKGFARWMPHINLLYPFIPAEHVKQYKLADKVKAALRDLEPFTVTLKRFSVFEHRESATVFLECDTKPEGALLKLQAKLEGLFPFCDVQSTVGGKYHPHMGLGDVKDKASS